MTLEPIDDNPQVQSLTIALKNICRDYPAGGTVLRELLQNADDAGATDVRFILDERTYPTDKLINPHLRQYQGPALLAYNSAEFTPHDFSNLLNIGNSLKLQDGLTTGKFGRGFNSVYNWTDSPSIVSGERLLILDLHRSWSKGGPFYNFVENFENVAIQNQMTAFRSVLENPRCPFKGTIIRIPLRNKVQATKSEISSHETTVSEMQEVLRIFADEFRDGGLLFMRNIEKLGIESTAGLCIKIEMANCNDIRAQKSKINIALKDALKSPDFAFNHSFAAGIKYSFAEELGCAEFAVHHSIRGTSTLSNHGLRDWANSQKLIPWVAIAARIPCPEKFQGKLFSVLPLPIATRQPVYIHGLFSISPDRARLYQLGDTSTQDRTPALWNDLIFRGPVPEAWAKLLSYLAITYPHRSGLEWWPQDLGDSRDPLTGTMQSIIKIIEKESLPLFLSEVGYVAASSAFLATGHESIALRDALKVAKAPVVYIPQRLWHGVKGLFSGRILSPPILTSFLANEPDLINAWEDATKQAILEYLMSKPGFFEYDVLKLFPFEDGQYRSVKDHDAFVHRDEFERDLFCREGHRNIDLSRVSAVTRRTLTDGCEASTIHPSIQRRSISDLGLYYKNNIFNKVLVSQDMVVLEGDAASFVSKAWTWIENRRLSNLDAAIADLWLIPLTNSYFRKIRPRNSSSEIIIAQESKLADLLKQFDAKTSSKAPLLLLTGPDGVSSYAEKLLIKAAGLDSHLFIKDSRNMVHLTRWLNQNADIVNVASNEEKNFLMKHIESALLQPLPYLECKAIGDSLRPLEIFKKLSWKAEGDKMLAGTEWTCLDASKLSIVLREGINPIPEIDEVQFIDAPWASYSNRLLEKLGLAECKGITQIIEGHVIKAWKSEQFTNQRELQKLAIVPVANINGDVASKFSIAEELIDPSVPELRNLFFDEDEVIPVAEFFSQFQVALKGCGLKTTVDEALINRQIRCYSNSSHSALEIQQRAHCLLKSTCRWTSPVSIWEDSELRTRKWLPVIDVDGTIRLEAPNQCRGRKDRLLVNLQLPILDIPVSVEWEIQLGWHNKLPHSILLGQLNKGLERNDRAVVNAVCFNIAREGQLEALATQLMRTPFVLTTKGIFTILESKVPLGEADVAVAIKVLNLASRFDRASLTDLKVLSKDGKFYRIEDISYHNLGPLIQVEDVNLTHPDIPLKTIQKVGIELLSDRQIKGLLEISDIADEDEFDQKEQVTTRITNTLEAYPLDSTFREYLANADDTKGASAISWLLDERYHPDEKLLTPELKRFQGPSFLVYNDGVFSEDDFNGFKNVGEGSKRQDMTSIGQFGRGKYLLILDPQQEVLPKNQIKGKRKPGVKLELSKLKGVCPDQLAPFEGLWKYTKDLDNYPGTIFRFPLRLETTESKLKTSNWELDGDEIRRLMDDYFHKARISLLFLRRICSIDFMIYGKHNLGWSLSRQTPFDEGMKSFSESVNRYLLGTALPKLYLSFLDDIGARVPRDVFSFWPQTAPPKRSCSETISLAEVKWITGSVLRAHCKLEPSRLLLQKAVSKNPEVLEVLLKLAIPAGDDQSELDGCHFLPLNNGTLGTLKLLHSNIISTEYYMASTEEIKLFEFASMLLISTETGKTFEKALESGKFNIQKLRLCHLQKLLVKRVAPKTVSAKTKMWLIEFWKYWNKRRDSLAPGLIVSTDGLEVYLATCNGREVYVGSSALEEFPAVIEPTDVEEQNLCEKIPGLYILSNNFMPASQYREGSLSIETSFYRFIRATRALAYREEMSLGGFLTAHLNLADMKHCYKPLVEEMCQIYKPETPQYPLGNLLTQCKIAANRKNTLCRASDLFDHEDQIFTSAFRIDEESKFLHKDIEGLRYFWMNLSLRHRKHSILNPADYLQCLQAMTRRIAVRNTAPDAYLESDCLAVLAPLITPSSSVQNFGPNEWISISQEAIFLAQTDFDLDLEYRRVHEPTKEVLSKVSSDGKPSLAMVWRHIENLKEFSQNLEQRYIQSFLADLYSSYAYIQNHHRSGTSQGIGNAAIWLNLNSAEGKLKSLAEVHSSWTSIQNLVLSSSCDAGAVKAVRPGLMRFENLLRALGCQTVTYPTVTRPVLHYGSSVLVSLQKLRAEGKLLDVKFFTEGKYIEAHRVVLAAVSEKCAVQFSGRWPVESVIKCGEEEDPVDYLSYHTLSTMINYAYKDKVDWSEMEVSDTDDAKSKATKLDLLLDLLKGADYWLIPALKSQVENRILDTDREFLNIGNAPMILERAAEAGSKAIEQLCIEFIKVNHSMVGKATASSPEENERILAV
ncbi:hypothetical protein V498_06566 [Pseudogymnoascus sp. VKM F-4517 (FW-2822)]|nr:hypothetical protein V498_06566 [Pseudogymnoascus sp. VKM F-4517 (FW-2822)]